MMKLPLDTKSLVTWGWCVLAWWGALATGLIRGPRFDHSIPREVVTQTGQTARLRCRVFNLGGETVSWVRKRDFHILTIASTRFTPDERFHLLHGEDSLDWTLQLKMSAPEDAGQYECQVSTTPKQAFVVDLSIVPGEAAIYGVDTVGRGSHLTLRCNVSGPAPPKYLDWRLNGTLLRPSRSGIRVHVQHEEARYTLSTLRINEVSFSSAGEYTCSPAVLAPGGEDPSARAGVSAWSAPQEPGPASASLRTGRQLTGPPPPTPGVVARHRVHVVPESKHARLWNTSTSTCRASSTHALLLALLVMLNFSAIRCFQR